MSDNEKTREQLILEMQNMRQETEALKEAHEKDITDLLKAREALIESEQNFKILADSGEVLVWASGLDKPCHYFNLVWLRFTGRTIEQESNDGWMESVHPEDLPMCRYIYSESYRKQKKFAMEYRLKRYDGEYRWIHDIASPNYNSKGEFIGYIGQCTDITDHKRAQAAITLKNEQLQKLNAEKDMFFSIIAHDLRSPFNAFLGLTQLLAEDIQDMELEAIQRLASNLNTTAANLYQLLENLLQWSLFQLGTGRLNFKKHRVKNLVEECMKIAIEQANKKSIGLTHDIPETLYVFTDKNIFQTVVRNLISNAIKFTPKGGKVTIHSSNSEKGEVEISVTDTGIGMDQKMIANLFLLNSKSNRSGTQGEPSSGLGLILCKDFVEKLGGKIRVESQVKVGTVFSFTLPKNELFD